MTKSADAFRTISEVADWLGVQTHVLRFWESKFAQVKPVKRAGGRRYYRPSDMLLLGGIRKLLHDDGLTIKGVQKILREEGVAYVADMSLPLDDTTDAQLEGDLVDTTGADIEMPAPKHTDTLGDPAPTSSPQPVDPMSVDAAATDEPTVPSFMRGPEPDPDPSVELEPRAADVPTLTPELTSFEDAGPAPEDLMAPADDVIPEQSAENEPVFAPPAEGSPEVQAPVETQDPESPAAPEFPFMGEAEIHATRGVNFDAAHTTIIPDAEPVAGPDPEPEPFEATPEPDSAPEMDASPEAEVAPMADVTPELASLPDTGAAPEPASEPAMDAPPEADIAPTADVTPELASLPETDATPEPASEPEVDAPPMFARRSMETEAAAPETKSAAPPSAFTPEAEAEPQPEFEPEPQPQPEPEQQLQPEPEPEPEPVPEPPRPRIVDVPDDEGINVADLAPSVLSKAAMARALTPAQRDAIRPLVAQLTALRDQMARARHDQH